MPTIIQIGDFQIWYIVLLVCLYVIFQILFLYYHKKHLCITQRKGLIEYNTIFHAHRLVTWCKTCSNVTHSFVPCHNDVHCATKGKVAYWWFLTMWGHCYIQSWLHLVRWPMTVPMYSLTRKKRIFTFQEKYILHPNYSSWHRSLRKIRCNPVV